MFEEPIRDARRHAPATERNRAPILSLLRDLVPPAATVLEIASGTGEHAAFFAERLPGTVWQPSDPDPGLRDSIAAWAETGAGAVLPPLAIDTASAHWPIARADAVVCINMIHIAPWAATEGLFRGAARLLAAGAPVFLYGPFKVGGRHTARSNAAFDDSLRRSDAHWGIRDVADVAAVADAAGFALVETVAMPANNMSVIFRRRAGTATPAGGPTS
jgi:hypothetical protein